MIFRNLAAVIFVFIFVLFAPVGAFAQTYQEMDAEAVAADQRLWKSTFLDPIGKRFSAEFDAGNYAKAIEEANKFLAYAPNAFGGIQVIRGRAHLELFKSNGSHKDFMNARADFAFAIQKKPDDVWNQIYLGELFLANHNGFGANRQFSKALAIDPNSFQALTGKAASAYFARDLQGCVSSIKSLMAHAEYQKQNDAWSHLRLGQCYASLGDKTNAAQNFERAVTLQPAWKGSWVYKAFAEDGYTCKPAGRKAPDKPFDRYVHYLRSSNCADGGAIGSLANVEKDDPNLKDDGLFHESEFQRRINKGDVSDQLTYEDAKSLYKEANFWIESARKQKKSIDLKSLNEFLEFFNHAINVNASIPNQNAEDFGVLARYERAKLLLDHPDKQIKILAWKEQIALSNIPYADYAGKRIALNGADVRARIIRGRVYSELKGNHYAAVAEFDAAIELQKVYARMSFSSEASIFAEPHWRKGDALAQLGEVDKAAIAYIESLKISAINPEATAGLQNLRTHPSVIGNAAAESKVYDLEMTSRINALTVKIKSADASFSSSFDSARDLKAKCSASYAYYRQLSDVRGQLVSLAGSIKRGTEIWQQYVKVLESVDSRQKMVNQGLAAC
ncbi:MAG TPA: hypothetical protein PLR83_01095 [Pyrinomonadaceae bacterium]|nr:hypothetical protein [Pyrinomonadaceae bacterium]